MADGKAEPLVAAPLSQADGTWSPDGRWIAYTSEEAGGEDVYVLPFPPTGERWRVSTSGGADPLWSRDGRELFYRSGGKVMAVDVRTSPRFSAGTPRALFDDTFAVSPNFITGYSVAADGRFLFAQPVKSEIESAAAASESQTNASAHIEAESIDRARHRKLADDRAPVIFAPAS